jgi:hypothetical protein
MRRRAVAAGPKDLNMVEMEEAAARLGAIVFG